MADIFHTRDDRELKYTESTVLIAENLFKIRLNGFTKIYGGNSSALYSKFEFVDGEYLYYGAWGTRVEDVKSHIVGMISDSILEHRLWRRKAKLMPSNYKGKMHGSTL